MFRLQLYYKIPMINRKEKKRQWRTKLDTYTFSFDCLIIIQPEGREVFGSKDL